MRIQAVQEIERLLCTLEREIDSTYCGVKHSTIYNLVENALTVLETERVNARLHENSIKERFRQGSAENTLNEDGQNQLLASLPDPERSAYQLREVEGVPLDAVAERLYLRPAKVLVLVQEARKRLLEAGGLLRGIGDSTPPV
jgi:DNA-directed RNA polymerase specialized sigma24 family protein